MSRGQELEYHNTNNLRGQALEDADKIAVGQKKWILAFFQRNPYTPMTPSAVKRAYDKANGTGHLNGGTGVLITSIRRAMSNLSKGKDAPLKMADIPPTKSPRGGMENYWILNIRDSLFGDLPGNKQERYGGL